MIRTAQIAICVSLAVIWTIPVRADDLTQINAFGALAVKNGAARYQVDEASHFLDVWNAPTAHNLPPPIDYKKMDEHLAGVTARAICAWGAGLSPEGSFSIDWNDTWTVRVFIDGRSMPTATCEINSQ